MHSQPEPPHSPFTACTAAATLLLLTLALSAQQPVEASASTRSSESTVPLPQPIASFGACRDGDWVYVYGGHVGRAHEHSRENVVGEFLRWNGRADGTWQSMPPGPALQGTALVAVGDGTLLRIGGMTATNAVDAAEDMHSTATVQRFDPRRACWLDETPLPEPRSSHDAVVVDGCVFVVGGWHLTGGNEGSWHATAWYADMRTTPLRWQPLPAPAPRRAASLAPLGDRIVLLGGIDAEGPTAAVEVYDPATRRWAKGPDLPGFAFGTAAVGVDDGLLATVFDGRLLRWDGGETWTPVARLAEPRLFHRLVPGTQTGTLLALGGADRRSHLRSVEAVRVGGDEPLRLDERVLQAPGRIAHRQALWLDGATLWAFGGNRGLAGDRFAAAQFATDVWRIDLTAATAERVGDLPHGCQSMATVRGTDAAAVLVGGLGASDNGVRSRHEVWRWLPQQLATEPLPPLPSARTQLEIVQHERLLWLFGGVDFTPDADGGAVRSAPNEVLLCDLDAAAPRFAPSGLQLPRPRRSHGAAVLAGRAWLVGGLGIGFAHAGPIDVLDLAARTWHEVAAPVDWVSPQVAALGDRLYVACGGTMHGQRFTPDPALWSWHANEGWRRVVAELPFAVRHAQMLPLGDRLLFYAVEGEHHDRVVLRTLQPVLRPDTTPTVTESRGQ